MNHGKMLRSVQRQGCEVTLTLKPHLSQPALDVGPMKVVQVDEDDHSAGFVMTDGSRGEREYPFVLIDTITPHVPGGLK